MNSDATSLDLKALDRDQTALVTGAGGYIGVPLCQALLKANYNVIALDRWFFGKDKIASLAGLQGFIPFTADLRDCNWDALLPKVSVVFDLAGLSNDATAEIDPCLTESINKDGAIRLARAAKAHGVSRYFYSSSASVYGAGVREGLTEKDKCMPQTAYAVSKFAVESVLNELTDQNFRPVILRNGTVFGIAPRMRFDLAVNIMTLRAWTDHLIYIMGGGSQWRPFVHVLDVVDAFMTVLKAPLETVGGEKFNVGSDEMNYQIKQIAQIVRDVIPNVALHWIPDDPDKRNYHVSFEKIKDQLNFRPRRMAHEGVVEIKQALDRGILEPEEPTFYTLRWYKDLLTWERRIREVTFNGRVL